MGKRSMDDVIGDAIDRKFISPLTVAYEYSLAASRSGFDWESSDEVLDKVFEEFHALLDAETDMERIYKAGDLIFVLVNYMRKLGCSNPDGVMDGINNKFYGRFTKMEQEVRSTGR